MILQVIPLRSIGEVEGGLVVSPEHEPIEIDIYSL